MREQQVVRPSYLSDVLAPGFVSDADQLTSA
jgi:hypothetical protein